MLALDLRLYLGIRDDDVLKPLAVGSNLYSCVVLASGSNLYDR